MKRPQHPHWSRNPTPERMEAPGSERHAPGGRRAIWDVAGLVGLSLLIGALHALVIWGAPEPTLFGDEGHYLGFAHRDASAGEKSLLPGRLAFHRRPELGSRLYAQLVGEDVDNESLLRRIGALQLAMLLGLVAAAYAQARLLGVGAGGAFAASALLGLSPWVGFYVYSAWPEIPHLLFLNVAFVCLLAYFKSLRLSWLIPAAAALGYTVFTKGTVNAFLPVIVVFAGAATAWELATLPPRQRWLRSAAASGTVLAGLLCIVTPQLARNASEGHGWRLGANRWDALEAGIRAGHSDYRDPKPPLNRRMAIGREYMQGGQTWSEREAAARDRTLDHLASAPIPQQIAEQTRKLVWCLFRSESFFEQSIGFRHRWGDAPPAAIAALRSPGRVLWYTILALGVVGLGAMALRSPGWLLLALFVGYLFLGLFLVPLKLRYAMPLVPPLCIFAGAALERGLYAGCALRLRVRPNR